MPKDYSNLVSATNKQNSLYNQARKSYNGIGSGSPKSKFVKSSAINQKKSGKFIYNISQNKLVSSIIKTIKLIFTFLFSVFFFWTVPVIVFLKASINYISNWLGTRENVLKFVFGLLFVVMIANLFSLQILGNGLFSSGDKNKKIAKVNNIIPAKKGNIYFRDLSQSRDDVPLTSNSLKFNSVFNPANLRQNLPIITQNLGLKNEQEALVAIANFVASKTNISSQDIIKSFNDSVDLKLVDTTVKKTENPWVTLFAAITTSNKIQEPVEKKALLKQYANLKKDINQDQSNAIDILREDDDANKIYLFTTWLSQAEQITIRAYPEGRMLSQTLGYTLNSPVNSKEANSRKHCREMVEKNQTRQTEIGESGTYQVGSYGIEQRYCTELGGLNGRSLSNTDLTNPEAIKNQTVQNGANLYLSFDKNVQAKTESVLEEAVIKNTNASGGPKDGCAIVMEAATGKLLAMASYPSFDPNSYADYFASNPKSVINNCTGNDYEVGSVMKPLTVATSITNKQNGGEGVDINYRFKDFDEKGKKYKDGDSFVTIQNAKNFSWEKFGEIGLKEIIRDSINTGIANIVEITGNNIFKTYFLDKLEFGYYGDPDYNLPNFAGSINGDTQSFDVDSNCEFCYANKAFGQGFSISALQLVRAYTALANHGNLVQPQWLEKIQCSDGKIENNYQHAECVSDESKMKPIENKLVFSKDATDATTGYMISAAEEGYLGGGPTKSMVDGYRVAIKSGTAQVSRPIIEPNGKVKPCDASCNTLRGIYDHTLIGYNTGDKRYIVMIKLAEPNPGVVENFSSTTLPVYFADIMKYTLEYLNVPKER